MRRLGQAALVVLAVSAFRSAEGITPLELTGNSGVPVLTHAQSLYMEGCGGCHGILGISANPRIPELRGQVGWFLCSEAGRQYLVRLPNVAFANVDDPMLADLMNFVVFDLGGASVPPGARPYSTREVALLRREPLKNTQLARLRESILTQARATCAIR